MVDQLPRRRKDFLFFVLLHLTVKCVATTTKQNFWRDFTDPFLIIRGGSTSATTTIETATPAGLMDETTTMMTNPTPSISERDSIGVKPSSPLIVFSDLDGTLIHYPDDLIADDDNKIPSILKLPPSSTGMVGVISAQTLVKCQEIRKQGVKLVLVSGMRSSTLLKRLPYLPKADAYCCEAGGRIYYPATTARPDGLSYKVVPVSYIGADKSDLAPFYVVEDLEWRRRMEQLDAAGPDGFVGNDMSHQETIPVERRSGSLWAFAQFLLDQRLVIDTKGYATCFRVNRKHQTAAESVALFDKFLHGGIPYPLELATSVNLGCIDFYPIISGKKHCCEYLAERFAGSKDLLSIRCVCICDDDNDVEMAMACSHAYIPSISSESMLETVQANLSKFTLTSQEGREGVSASEAALSLILERIHNF